MKCSCAVARSVSATGFHLRMKSCGVMDRKGLNAREMQGALNTSRNGLPGRVCGQLSRAIEGRVALANQSGKSTSEPQAVLRRADEAPRRQGISAGPCALMGGAARSADPGILELLATDANRHKCRDILAAAGRMDVPDRVWRPAL